MPRRLPSGFSWATGFAVWNYGSFFMVTNRANEGLGSVRALIATWGRAQDMAMGLGRVFEILDLVPDVQDAPDARPLAGIEHGVSFEAVTFGYEPAREVLQDVAFSAALGSVTAIVGPTGTGKSTLMSLLLRLADPDDGRIAIDGKDLRSVTVASIRRHIALATQEKHSLLGERARETFASPNPKRRPRRSPRRPVLHAQTPSSRRLPRATTRRSENARRSSRPASGKRIVHRSRRRQGQPDTDTR